MAVDPIRIPADRSGDLAPEAAAVQELYERHATRVYGFCLHQLGTREDAEDATQSTFLNAFRGLRRGVAPVAEAAWLLAIARNVCLTRLRAAVRRRRVEATRDLHALQDTVAARPAADGDELLWLEDALAGLPENQRRAILLREWQGLSYREIAAELETTQGAVETLIFRARRSLAERLEEPPSRRRAGRWAARSIDLGAAAGWLKALLAGGTAKAVATAAAVTTVAVVGSAPLRQADPAPEAASAAPSASGEASAAVSLSPPWSTSLVALTSPRDSMVARVSAAGVPAAADEAPFGGGADSLRAPSGPRSALLPPSDAPPATPVAERAPEPMPATEPAPPASEPRDEPSPSQAQQPQEAQAGRNERSGERGQPTTPAGAEGQERRNERATEQEERRTERAAEREQAQEERRAEQEARKAEQEERRAEQEQRRTAEPEPPPADPDAGPPPHAQDGAPGPPPTPPGQAKKNGGG